RRLPRPGADTGGNGLARNRAALWGVGAIGAVAGGGAKPCGGGGDGRRPPGGVGSDRRAERGTVAGVLSPLAECARRFALQARALRRGPRGVRAGRGADAQRPGARAAAGAGPCVWGEVRRVSSGGRSASRATSEGQVVPLAQRCKPLPL